MDLRVVIQVHINILKESSIRICKVEAHVPELNQIAGAFVCLKL